MLKKMITSYCLLICAMFALASEQSQYVDILDMTVGNKKVSVVKRNWGTSGPAVSSARPMVSVTLKLDKKRYVAGEKFIYEIGIGHL